MNILDAVAISMPCNSCGGRYQVPLRDVLLSHKILHQGCPVPQETECPPIFQSRLFERKDIDELQRTWAQLEQRARADGGELVLMGVSDSKETKSSFRANPDTAEPLPPAGPVLAGFRRLQQTTSVDSGERRTTKVQKRTHSSGRTRKNRR